MSTGNTSPRYVNVQPLHDVMRSKDEFLGGVFATQQGSDNGTYCNGLPLVQNNLSLGAVGSLH